MFSNDYIMRIIQQFIQALLAIIRARKADNHEQAWQLIQAASRRYLDTEILILLKYSPEQLLEHFKNDGYLDTEKCIFCAELFYELALSSESMNFKEAAERLKTHCLYLFVTAIPDNRAFQDNEYYLKVNSLIEELNGRVSEPLLKKIAHFQDFMKSK
jgi:hypothetical protein